MILEIADIRIRPGEQAAFDQAIENSLKAQRLQAFFDQPLAKVHQAGGVEQFVAQLTVQSEVPPGVIAEHLDGGTVGCALQELKQADSQHQYWFEGQPPVVRTITAFQLRPGRDQAWIDQPGKKPIAIGFGEEVGGESSRGKEFRLGREAGQAHK